MLDFNTTELSVRKAAATDALSSADLLTHLSHDPDGKVRMAVAGNPSTPREVLLNLGKEFPDEVTANPIFNILLLEDPESQFIRLSLARSSTISEAALLQFSSIGNEEILCAIAQNPVTPLSILETLVHHPPQLYEDADSSDYDRIFAGVAKNPNVSVKLLTKLAEYGGGVCYAIAANPKTPPHFLEQFAIWRNFDMHKALMQNPAIPSSVLEILAGGLWPNIHIKQCQVDVKTHPNVSEMAIRIANFIEGKPGTPVYVLEKLACDYRAEVRRLVAEHPSTSPAALEKLVQDKEQNIRHLVAHHPHLTSEALEKLTDRLVADYLEALKYQSSDLRSWELTFLAILKHPNLTSRTVDALLYLVNLADHNHRNAQSIVIETILQHEKLLGSKLLELIQSFKGNLYLYSHTALTKNPNLTTEILEILIQELQNLNTNNIINSRENYILRPIDPQTFKSQTQQFERRANEAIAQLITHPNILPERLEDFSTHDYDLIRKGVAKNPNTPLPVLQMLATHPTLGNRHAVAQNPNVPTLFLRFAVDSDESVRKAVAQNKHTPLVILETLADDERPFVRCALATNPSTPAAILMRLFDDPVEKVRESLLDNQNLPTQLLGRFADDPSPQLRANAAQHPNTPIHSLIKLAQEGYSGIRHTLLTRGASLPDAVLSKLAESTFAQIRIKSDQECNQDREDAVMDRLAQHPNTPIQILEMFASNQPMDLYQRFGEYWFNFLRKGVAKNTSTPTYILENLVNDPQLGESGAREEARKTLRNRI